VIDQTLRAVSVVSVTGIGTGETIRDLFDFELFFGFIRVCKDLILAGLTEPGDPVLRAGEVIFESMYRFAAGWTCHSVLLRKKKALTRVG
jgi:hypothetical protein